MLDEVAAARDVQHLQAAADREHGHVARERGLEQPQLRAVAPDDRARLLRRLAALVEEHGEELARIESRNVGKPIAGARFALGVLWHPEAGEDTKLFEALVDEARAFRSARST